MNYSGLTLDLASKNIMQVKMCMLGESVYGNAGDSNKNMHCIGEIACQKCLCFAKKITQKCIEKICIKMSMSSFEDFKINK